MALAETEHGPTLLLAAERARGLMEESLTQLGLPAAEAATCADCYLFASLRGVDSHGIIVLFPGLARNVASGAVRPAAITVEQSAASAARLDGRFAAGAVIGVQAMDLAIARARETGVGVTVAANCNHFGAASYYCCRAADAGMIGLAMCDAFPNVAPYGGAAALHGTNPIAYAVPLAGQPPIVLDIATSVVAHGQVAKARRRGQSIPLGWALDGEGRPTTDPNAAKLLLPFGGHKGSGLALLVDILCAALAGSAITLERRQAAAAGTQPGQSFFFLALDPAAFGSAATFAGKAQRLANDVHSIPPAEGVAQVLLPGELEGRTYEQRSREGIPLYPEDWAAMVDGLSQAGLNVPALADRWGPRET